MANQATLDPRKVMTGHDGKLYITVGKKSYFMANVDTFQSQINFKNISFTPIGDYMEYAIPDGFSVSLTFTEAVVSDEFTLGPILDAISKGVIPVFDFRGVLDRAYDNKSEELTYGNCVPDGSFDLQNFNPGEVIKRATSFRVNEIPKFLKKLVG